jgi:hypothetical protein
VPISDLQSGAAASRPTRKPVSGRDAPIGRELIMQQFLMQFSAALNRRRAYAATHPMVLAAESQWLDATQTALASRSTLSIGVARHELLIDGAPYDARSGVARELAGRLHRRGVGSISIEAGLGMNDLRDALAWMAREAGGADDAPPAGSKVHITRTAYDLLILDDAIRDAQSAIASLWRVLAEVTGIQPDLAAQAAAAVPEEFAGLPLIDEEIPDGTVGFDTDAILRSLRDKLKESAIARRTAVALMELTNHGAGTSDEGRAMIGAQLLSLLERLGSASLNPIIKSLADSATQHRFVSQSIDVLPVAEAVTWLNAAASASEQQISHSMLRLMSKLSTVATDRGDPASESAFRDAARDLVDGWTLADPNPVAHVELLDRIAGFERNTRKLALRKGAPSSASIESSRLVQMALELDTVGEDTIAAVEALIGIGEGRVLMQWLTEAAGTSAALELRRAATSDRAVRQLLLTEPVDRLGARALLEELDITSADTLLDVLSEAGTKGTRLLVRQRLAEFGEAITPRLIARLADGPWYLVRNVLSLLHESEAQRSGEGAAAETIASLLDHAQVQVRIEALRVLTHMDGDRRSAALSRALHDDNERVVVVALQELADAHGDRSPVPDAIVPQLMALVDAGKHSDPVRARAIRTLGATRSDVVRDWLTSLVSRKSMILRRLTLVDPTQSAVSALHVLTRVYADDSAAAPVLAMAQRVSGDTRWQLRDTGSSAERAT